MIRAVSFALALLGLLGLVGCGGAASSSKGDGRVSPATERFVADYGRTGPFTTLADSTRPAGTTMGPGLKVPTGAVLLGPVFPDAAGSDSFLALGLVLGDPVAVFNDFISQAQQLGMSVSDGGGCLSAAGSLACVRTVTDPGDGEALTVRVERRPAAPGFMSHVAVRYQAPGSVPFDQIGFDQLTPPTVPPPPVALPDSVLQPSDLALNASVAPLGPALGVRPGSLLVAPPGPCGCSPTGWSAVLRVTGDPQAVIANYVRARTSLDIRSQRTVDAGKTVRVADLGLVAGGVTQLRTVTENGVTYLLIAVAML